MVVNKYRKEMTGEFAHCLIGALAGVGIVAALALNPFRSAYTERINRVLEKRSYVELDHKTEFGSWRYPLGTVGIDEGKDGSIDKIEFRGYCRIPLYFEFGHDSRVFESMQRLYGAHRNSSGNDVL